MPDEEIIQVYREMSSDALEGKLTELRGDLAELEEQNLFMLRSTGHHLRGVVRKKMARKLKEMKELIHLVEELLEDR
jgi:ribosomal protein L29